MEIMVNGNLWKIEFVKPTSRNLLRSDGSSTLGVCDNGLKKIFIVDNVSRYMTDKILCHELTHLYAMEYDYYMPVEVEEIVADFLSLFGRDIIYMADDVMSKILRRAA